MSSIFEYLNQLEISYQLYEHPEFFTCEQSSKWFAENITEDIGGESKNLFLRNRKGDTHYLVVIESSKQLDLKALATDLNESKLSFASPERLQKYLNLRPGSVSVFALIQDSAKDVKLIFDYDLMKHKKLHYHPPGRNDQTLVINTKDLKKFLESLPQDLQFELL